MEVAAVTGRVDDSLFNAVEDGENPRSWPCGWRRYSVYDLDFYTDPRQGRYFSHDSRKEKNMPMAKPPDTEESSPRNIENAGKKYQLYSFMILKADQDIIQPMVSLCRKAFLRSPLKFGAPVTSHFSRARFHPILKPIARTWARTMALLWALRCKRLEAAG